MSEEKPWKIKLGKKGMKILIAYLNGPTPSRLNILVCRGNDGGSNRWFTAGSNPNILPKRW